MFASCTQPQSDEFRLPARALNDLLAIKDANAKPVKRPICSMVWFFLHIITRLQLVSRADWLPPSCNGREMCMSTYMGAFLNLSVMADPFDVSVVHT
jgi:hypothetical protein